MAQTAWKPAPYTISDYLATTKLEKVDLVDKKETVLLPEPSNEC
jgi:hypothetical protein